MPLHQVFTYVIAAIMAMFAAHQVLESNGIIFMPTLPAFNPFTEELFPIFYKQESEPSPSTPTFESTPFTATESIMIAPTVSSPIPSISSSKTASETIQVDPTTPRGERLTDDTLPMQHTMTSDTLDDSNYLENDEDATDGCSTVCQFFLKHRKLFIVYAVLSLKWDSYLQHHLENIIDFRTHRVMAIGAVFGTFFALIILIRAMTTSSGTLPRVPIDVSLVHHTASDVYAEVQEQAHKVDLQLAMAELKKLRQDNTRLSADYNTLQGKHRVKTEEAYKLKTAIDNINTALSIKRQDHISAEKSLNDLRQSNETLRKQNDTLSQQVQENSKDHSTLQRQITDLLEKSANMQKGLDGTNHALKEQKQTTAHLREESANEKRSILASKRILEVSNTELSAKCGKYQTRITELETSLENEEQLHRDDTRQLEDRITKLGAFNENLSSECTSQLSSIEHLEHSLSIKGKAAEDDSKHLKERIQNLESSIAKEIGLHKADIRELENRNASYSGLEEQLSNAKEEIKRTEEKLAQSQIHNIEKVDSLCEQLRVEKEEVEGAKAKLQKAEQKYLVESEEVKNLKDTQRDLEASLLGNKLMLKKERKVHHELAKAHKGISKPAVPSYVSGRRNSISDFTVMARSNIVLTDPAILSIRPPKSTKKPVVSHVNKADNSSDDDEEAEDSGKVTRSGPTKRRRKRKHAGAKPLEARSPSVAEVPPLAKFPLAMENPPAWEPDILW